MVIPALNAGRFLPAALASVFAQTSPATEVIVVDDGSTDNTAEVLAGYAGRVRVVSGERRGVSAARNLGVASARGELIAFLDADDRWHPIKLERQLRDLMGDPAVIASFASGTVSDEATGRRWVRSASATAGGQGLTERLVLEGPVVGPAGSTAIVRRDAFESAGGFDTAFAQGEDWDLWLRLSRLGGFAIVAEPLADIRVHAGNASRNLTRAEQDNERVLEKAFTALPADAPLRRLRRAAYGNLHQRFVGAHLAAGDLLPALRSALLAAWYRPGTIVTLLRAAARRVVRP